MEAVVPSAMEQQEMVSSFREIAAGQSAETALQFLQATSWKLEEAIQLFYLGNDGGGGVASSSIPPPTVNSTNEIENSAANDNLGNVCVIGDDGVRAPLPVKRETLYGDASISRLHPSPLIAFRNFEEESRRPAVWESEQSAASTASGSRDNLASLYRPPFALMYQGTFDKAKMEASFLDKWLLVNLQSTEEFSSHMLNRDTWANEAVAQTIRTNFIFWQVYNDSSEGKKVCTYYNLVSIPAILVIDPVTGQKMRAWSGMVQPDRLLEDLLPYLEKAPKDYHEHPLKRRKEVAQDSVLHTPGLAAVDRTIEEDEEVQMALAASLEGLKDPIGSHAVDRTIEEDEEVQMALAASLEGLKDPIGSPAPSEEPKTETNADFISSNGKPIYPALPEEPKGNRELLCRVGVRLPNGRRVQRNFLRSDPIKLLWSFGFSLLSDGESSAFHFTQAIPGASKTLDYGSDQTFDEAGLANSMVSMAWD